MPTNPTNGLSQFTAPYDILPNTIYTNPTNAVPSQFNGPYNKFEYQIIENITFKI